MPFEFHDTPLQGVTVVVPEVYEDDRGLFMESYVKESFENEGIDAEFVQDNYSESRADVLRGLHFQRGAAAQGKLVQCLHGAIFDVVVDLRRESETFGEWLSMRLSRSNRKMLYVPRGFAHGFLALSDEVVTRYKLDNYYAPEKETGIRWDDPTLDIDWPVEDPILSEKDTKLPTFLEVADDAFPAEA